MADLSQVRLPSGNYVNIKDQGARDLIAALGTPAKWIGITTTTLTDGATTNPITINGSPVTATTGNIAGYTPNGEPTQEFIFDGTIWQELGSADFSSLGDLAYKDDASGSYVKPTGSGTISSTATSMTVTATETVSGAYEPKGSVSAPTISVDTAGSTATIKNPTKATVALTVESSAPGSTAPSNPITTCAYDATTETLSFYQIGYTTGDSITTSDVTVKTGDATYTASQPTFTGTKVDLEGSYDKATGVTVGTTTDTVTVS